MIILAATVALALSRCRIHRKRRGFGLGGAILAGAFFLMWNSGAGPGHLRAAETQAPSGWDLTERARLVVIDARSGATLAEAANLLTGKGTPAALAPGNAFLFEWSELHDVREIRLQCARVPALDRFQADAWMADPPTQAVAVAQGSRWVTQALTVSTEGQEVVLRLRAPDAAAEPAVAVSRSGVPTQRIRVASSVVLLVEKVRVLSAAATRSARLQIEWEPSRRAPGRPLPTFSGVGLRVLKAASANPTLWNLQVEYAAGAGPEAADRGLLTVRDGESASFSIFLEDALAPEGVRIPALGVSVRGDPTEPRTADVQLPAVAAFETEAAAEASRNRSRASVVLGVPGLRQKFSVGAGGEVRLQNNTLRGPGPDLDARPWKWPDLVYQVGLGEHPRMGPDANLDVARSLEEGWLPVVHHGWTRGGVACEQRTLVGTLLGDPADLESTNGCDPTVLVSRFELRNLTDTPQPVWLWAEMSRSHPVRLSWDGTLFLLHPSDGRTRTNVLPVRAHFQNFGVGTIDLAVLVPGGPGSFNPDLGETAVAREAIRYQTVLPPRGTAALEMVVPGVELLTPEQVQALKALRFEKLRELTVRFWQEQWAGGASWDLPDPTWQHALQTAHWQLLTALEVDPATGRLVAAKAEGGAWRGRDVASVIDALERRGEHRLARLLIESSAAAALDPAGLFRASSHVATNSPSSQAHVYCTFPALTDRARILEAAARHGRWAQDKHWGERFAGEFVRLSDLLLAGNGISPESDRDKGPSAQPKAPSPRKVGWLDEEAVQWRAVARAAQALEIAQHAEAARLAKAASVWAEDLRVTVLEQTASTPVVPISNGIYAAWLPLRWDAVGRRGVGSERSLAHAPWDLFVDGPFPAEHPLAERLWDEWRTRWPAALDTPNAADFVLRRASATETSPVLEQACRQTAGPERLGAAGLLEAVEISRRWQEMVVADLGDRLELARGVPASWWEPGRRWSVLHLPTRLGGLDVRALTWADEQVTRLNVAWTTEGIGAPLRLWLPVTGNRPAREVVVNGRPALWKVGQAYLDLAAGPRLWDIQVKF